MQPRNELARGQGIRLRDFRENGPVDVFEADARDHSVEPNGMSPAAPSTWGGAWRGRPGRVGGGHDMYRQVPLRRLPLSGRGYQPRRVAVLPLSAEPARGPTDAGGRRHRREP